MKADFGKWAVVAVSRDATALALKTRRCLEGYPVEVYTKAKYMTADTKEIEGNISDFFGKIMADYDTIVCIMATGIVVRGIAPHLGHKSTDPAILVMDAAGDYIISLLSGHLGGANAAATMLAKRLDAQPVITTGTDVKGSMAVDVLAEKLGCTIADFTDAKDVTAAILDGELVSIVDTVGLDFMGIVLPGNVKVLPEGASYPTDDEFAIWISDRVDCHRIAGHTVQLVPKTMTVGVGCRKGMDGEHIITEIEKMMVAQNYHANSIKYVATIGLKAEETGIADACDHFGTTLKVVPDEFIKMVQSKFEGSDFVEKTTGLRAVAEPCAYVASGFGRCVVQKVKCQGVTLALYRGK